MACPDVQEARQHLLECFSAGVLAVQGRPSVYQALAKGKAGELLGNWHLIGVGKAAASMAQGAIDALGDRIVSGLVISKTGHFEGVDLGSRFTCMEAEHPVPGEGTLSAGAALLEYCESLPAGAQVLCCISGGASSLVEALPEGMSLSQLQALNNYLLGTGLDISSMNRIRQSLSRIKAGRLADHLSEHKVTALYISDVPGDDIPTIGSGPLAPPLVQSDVTYPEQVKKVLGDIHPVPSASVSHSHVSHRIVASLGIAKDAASKKAKELGYEVFVHTDFLEGEAGTTAVGIAGALKDSKPGIHIWGGETVVMLPDAPGRGGRNQHFALAAAQVLESDDSLVLLAAGTDGSDGPTQDAGGLVDSGTLQRGRNEGLNALVCLEKADSGSFLEAAGDLLNTGPTGTNVMDLVIGLKC